MPALARWRLKLAVDLGVKDIFSFFFSCLIFIFVIQRVWGDDKATSLKSGPPEIPEHFEDLKWFDF